MASNTPNLNLYKKDPVKDGEDVFNVETMLNENWDKIDKNAENVSRKNKANGYAGLNADKQVVSDGNVLSSRVNERVLGFSFSKGSPNQRVDLFTTGALVGYIEVTLTGGWNSVNSSGKITKRFNIVTSASTTINSQDTQYTEVTGTINQHISISKISWDTANSRWKISIEARNAGGAGIVVAVAIKSVSPILPPTWKISDVYSGDAPTTLPLAVQTLPDDVVLQSGREFQKHKLTENTGQAFAVNSGNVDNIKTPGFYSITNTSVTGLPLATTGLLEVLNTVQRFTETPTMRTWKRRLSGSTWNAWVEDENASRKNAANGYGGLDSNAKLPRVNTYNSLGGSGSHITDLDTLFTSGVYPVANNAKGTPLSGEFAQVLVHVSSNETHNNANNWIWQMLFGTGGNTYVRRKVNNGAWQPWVPMWTGYNDAALFTNRGLIANNTDLNTLTTNGIYSFYRPSNVTYQNSPNVTFGILFVYKADPSTAYVKQEVIDITNGNIHVRTKTTIWTDWKNMSNADTVDGFHAAATASPNTLTVRNANGKIAEVAATRTAVHEVQLTKTGYINVGSHTAKTSAMFTVKTYLRVTASGKAVSLAVNYTSLSGFQSRKILVTEPLPIGDYDFIPVTLKAQSGTAIDIVAATTEANGVFISAVITEEG